MLFYALQPLITQPGFCPMFCTCSHPRGLGATCSRAEEGIRGGRSRGLDASNLRLAPGTGRGGRSTRGVRFTPCLQATRPACACLTDAKQSEAAAFTAAAALSRLLAQSCWFPLFPEFHGVTQRGPGGCHTGSGCVMLRSTKLGKFTSVVDRSRPALRLGGDIPSSSKVAPCKPNPEKWPRHRAVRALLLVYPAGLLRAIHGRLPLPQPTPEPCMS